MVFWKGVCGDFIACLTLPLWKSSIFTENVHVDDDLNDSLRNKVYERLSLFDRSDIIESKLAFMTKICFHLFKGSI